MVILVPLLVWCVVMAFWTKTEGGDRFDKGLSIGYFLVIFKTIQEAS